MSVTQRYRIHVYEIEHTGDLRREERNIQEAGGRVVVSTPNYDAETAVITADFLSTYSVAEVQDQLIRQGVFTDGVSLAK